MTLTAITLQRLTDDLVTWMKQNDVYSVSIPGDISVTLKPEPTSSLPAIQETHLSKAFRK